MSQANVPRLIPPYLVEAEKLRKNKGQWKAYESRGDCVILAGPGSGKTKTLTVKLVRMLAEDVRFPQKIACLTYNKECVRELRRRLAQLGVAEGHRAVIGTVHSFCLQHVVRPYGRLAKASVPDPLRVALESEQEELFTKALANAVSRDENPRQWRSRCDVYRRTRVNREAGWDADDEDAARVITAYERLLLEGGLIDFDGMILTGLQLIRNHAWVRRALVARFPILVVDEYQDLGHALHEIVLRLCFPDGSRLLAVGDPDQSIYGFNGAEPKLLRDLSKVDGVEVVPLTLNYRCGPTIIRASEAALNSSRDYLSASDVEGTVDFHQCRNGLEEQVEKACKQIIPAALKRREGRKLGDIAVLYRDKNDGEVMAAAVETEGWDFIRTDRGNPYPRSPVVFWLEDCAAWCAGGWQRGEPSLSSLMRTWLAFNPSAASDAARRKLRVEVVRFLYGTRDADQSLHEWLQAFWTNCLRATLDADETLRDDKQAVEELIEVCTPKNRLERYTVGGFGGQSGTSSHLNLMTLHSAKGLEFDVVIMIGMEQGRTPDFRAVDDRKKGDNRRLESERRLFYVGLTRARHEVHLVYSGWYKNKYGRSFEPGRSEFIDEVERVLQDQ